MNTAEAHPIFSGFGDGSDLAPFEHQRRCERGFLEMSHHNPSPKRRDAIRRTSPRTQAGTSKNTVQDTNMISCPGRRSRIWCAQNASSRNPVNMTAVRLESSQIFPSRTQRPHGSVSFKRAALFGASLKAACKTTRAFQVTSSVVRRSRRNWRRASPDPRVAPGSVRAARPRATRATWRVRPSAGTDLEPKQSRLEHAVLLPSPGEADGNTVHLTLASATCVMGQPTICLCFLE